jgi:LysR family tdc operon transcriptional activator
MSYLPKIQQLRIFNEIIQNGSIRAAAKKMNLSQPALTRSLRELEQVLGATLIIRSNDGAILTEAGKSFSVYSSLILEELERATIDIKQINQKVESNVAFGVSSLLAVTILSSVIKDFKKRHPSTNILLKEAQLSTLLPSLREGLLDFAVGTLDEIMPLGEFIVEPLFTAPFSIVARKGHPLIQSTSLDDLKHAKWLLPETNMGYYNNISKVIPFDFSSNECAPVFSDSSVCIINMVANDDYLTILSKARIAQPKFSEQLSPINIVELLPDASYGLIRLRKHPLNLSACTLIKTIKYYCKEYNWSPDL